MKKFVQPIMHNDKKDETYFQARIHLQKQQKERTSLSLPSDPDLLLQPLKRAQLQTLVWCQCNMAEIKHFDPEVLWMEMEFTHQFSGSRMVCWSTATSWFV